jgi:hypothetical protein
MDPEPTKNAGETGVMASQPAASTTGPAAEDLVLHSSSEPALPVDVSTVGQAADVDAPAAAGPAATKFDPLEGAQQIWVQSVLPAWPAFMHVATCHEAVPFCMHILLTSLPGTF